MDDETAIPVFPCASPEETLEFYRALGFEVTHEHTKPYVYLAVRRGGLDLHFTGGGKPDPAGAAGLCLVMVADVAPHHRAFAAALRGKLGRVPTAGRPRITRLRRGQRRFTVVDPGGNSIIFIARDEPEYEYPDKETWARLSPLERALETAANFRDLRGMDEAAAKVLDLALAKHPTAAPVERARALAARVELALALGDAARARSARAELDQVPLSDEERERCRDELQAADAIERMQGLR
jgi:catechol 2,3-dioxygenase-like lactoylglutathione lyase family enzyme